MNEHQEFLDRAQHSVEVGTSKLSKGQSKELKKESESETNIVRREKLFRLLTEEHIKERCANSEENKQKAVQNADIIHLFELERRVKPVKLENRNSAS